MHCHAAHDKLDIEIDNYALRSEQKRTRCNHHTRGWSSATYDSRLNELRCQSRHSFVEHNVLTNPKNSHVRCSGCQLFLNGHPFKYCMTASDFARFSSLDQFPRVFFSHSSLPFVYTSTKTVVVTSGSILNFKITFNVDLSGAVITVKLSIDLFVSRLSVDARTNIEIGELKNTYCIWAE
jgi:hypothetical protein